MSGDEAGIPRRPPSSGIASSTPRGSARPPLPAASSVNVSLLAPMPNPGETTTPLPKRLNPHMRMSSNWNSEHWKSLLGLKYIEKNSENFDEKQDIPEEPTLPTPNSVGSKPPTAGSGLWSRSNSVTQVHDDGHKPQGSSMSMTGVVGARQQQAARQQLEEGGVGNVPTNLASPSTRPPPSAKGMNRLSFSGGVPFSPKVSLSSKLSGSVKTHTRFMSMGRVDSFNRAAGLKPEDDAGGAYADDAVVLTRQSKPDPQGFIPLGSTSILRIIIILNIGFSCLYLWWRAVYTITGIDTYFFGVSFLPVQIWAWVFYGVEICLVIGILIGHTQRMFPIQRTIVTMDEVVAQDESLGYNARCCIVIPCAGERLDIVMFALLGAVSQRTWIGGSLTKSQILRIIILDEKRRKGVLNMTAAVYALQTLIRNPEVVTLLQAEGIKNPCVKGFYEWWKVGGGYARKHLYNEPWLNKACLLMEYMEKHSGAEGGGDNIFLLSDMPNEAGESSKTVQHNNDIETFALSMLQALNIPSDSASIEKGYVHQFSSFADLPTLIYYSRKDSGTPKVSPKAGNMNAALFAIDYPEEQALVANSTILVVNDCRHQLNSTFLQRTVPYFFELDGEGKRYGWARVAFVQTPQRFKPDQLTADDPLGNHAAVQYDVINHGKDGIGAVSSSGHGSLWRVEALRGADVDGVRYADPTDLSLVGKSIGFRSEMLVEDTHTSIDMFRHGWTSRYVNEPGEHLSVCTHQPNSIAWRIKQVLRWHQGAVQLLFYKGVAYTSFGGQFPTVWHRIYGFDQATYYLQAFPGYILLMMPIIYGVTGFSPFQTEVAEFFRYFTPFIVTGMLPTVISGSWRGIDSNKLQRDEQVWLSTTYVQIYAFISMLWTTITGKSHENAWAIKAPTWPLFAVFFGQIAALGGALYWVSKEGFTAWAQNLISVFASAILCIHALWPMVSMQMGWKVPSMYIIKIMVWFLLGFFIVVINRISTA